MKSHRVAIEKDGRRLYARPGFALGRALASGWNYVGHTPGLDPLSLGTSYAIAWNITHQRPVPQDLAHLHEAREQAYRDHLTASGW